MGEQSVLKRKRADPLSYLSSQVSTKPHPVGGKREGGVQTSIEVEIKDHTGKAAYIFSATFRGRKWAGTEREGRKTERGNKFG